MSSTVGPRVDVVRAERRSVSPVRKIEQDPAGRYVVNRPEGRLDVGVGVDHHVEYEHRL